MMLGSGKDVSPVGRVADVYMSYILIGKDFDREGVWLKTFEGDVE